MYEVQVELEHDVGPCGIHLWWESRQTPRQIVPAYYLYQDSQPVKGSPFDISVT